MAGKILAFFITKRQFLTKIFLRMMSVNPLFVIFLLFFAVYGCRPEPGNQTDADEFMQAKYAELFEIKQQAGYTQLNIYSKNRDRKTSYILTSYPDSFSQSGEEQIIKVPAEKIICLSTTHLGFLKKLNKQETAVGAGGTEYLYDTLYRRAVKTGELHDIGYEGNLNLEKIIQLQADLMTIYRIEGEQSEITEIAKRYKLPNILINEYLEPSVLGQAEWIKVFGLLTGTEKTADSIFSAAESNYLKLKKKAEEISNKPKVLLNMPWKGTWYVPCGNSNIANLIRDAGGQYLWDEANCRHNRPMSLESVYEKAQNADVWLNPGQADRRKEILATDERLGNLPAVKNDRIYNRIARISPSGGNDYMESGVINPDKILSDLIKVLHPEIPDDSLYYYRKVE